MESSIFRDLLAQLQTLLQIYRELFVISQDKKDHIIKNYFEGINEATMKESKLIHPVPELEEGIRNKITKLQRELGFRPKLKMTLTELVLMITNPEEKQQLEQIQKDLLEASQQLSRANELNQQLLQQAAEYVEFSLDVLIGPPEDEVTYKKPAMQLDPQKRTGLYDIKG